jgi:pyruvate,water dikinase
MTSPQASPFILNLDSPQATLERVGGKGASLARMVAAGLPVPPGFHITTDAYRRYVDENHLGDRILSAAAQAQVNDPAALDRASEQIQSLIAQGTIPGDIAGMIRRWYGELGGELGADAPVAVRSSATAEDLPGMSFAGQLESYLNVSGGDEVIHAVKRCWASLWTGRAIAYRERQGIRPEDVSMAVVVQRLVAAEVAGVVFTANPVTGARDELMINAAWGLGEAIVSGRVTPDTIVINKQTGAIASQEIADKEVMTVRSHAGTREEPVPVDQRHRAALEPAQGAELARLGVKIEQLYGQAMDIEWAMCDGRIFIVQARPVTALPEPRAALEWKVLREGRRYFRTSVAELLPDPLSPLFATLALPLWNQALQDLTESLRIQFLKGVALMTIHEYVYYDFALTGWQTVRLIVALPFLVPRLVRIRREARARWADGSRPRYANVAGAWTARDLMATPAVELLAGAREIVAAAANYYVSIQLVLGMVNLSEAAFTSVYNHLLKRAGDPPALTFLLGFDSEPIRAEKSLYDLAMWAREQGELAEYLPRASGKDIAAAYESQSPPIADGKSWREFAGRLGEHLRYFGHTVYDLDFAKSLPAEDPVSLVETLRYFLAGQGRNPHERQAAAAAARGQATDSLLARLSGLRLRLFRRVLRWAQCWAPVREDALADVGLGWPVLRRMLREVGRRLTAANALTEGDEVFWLKWEEVGEAAQALDAGRPVEDYCRVIAERRETWKQAKAVTPPVVLPIKGGSRLFGFDVSRWMPARSNQAASSTIKGIGASPGKVTGPACVIHGPEEFDQMKPGDILVANITTPAWTPLFAMASGIVTDVGGPLSHSSIVAREYGVPAVLGTGVATHRIRGGQQITVDGDGGVVTLGG